MWIRVYGIFSNNIWRYENMKAIFGHQKIIWIWTLSSQSDSISKFGHGMNSFLSFCLRSLVVLFLLGGIIRCKMSSRFFLNSSLSSWVKYSSSSSESKSNESISPFKYLWKDFQIVVSFLKFVNTLRFLVNPWLYNLKN